MSELINSLTVKDLIYVVFFASFIWFEIQSLRKDIKRIDEKVEKHNSFDRRIVALETTVKIYKEEHKI